MSWCFDLATAIGGRTEQQDRAELFEVPGHPGGHLVVLADGMGGQALGGLAAQTVIETAGRELAAWTRKGPRDCLTDFCHAAHERIREIGRAQGVNPASTCTAVYLTGDEAYWVHVGDSRLYHFNGDRLLYRTDDHTLGTLLAGYDSGGGVADVEGRHGNRLYMCLGGNNTLEPEFGATAVGRDDWFMLCSDGFWSQVDGEEAAGNVANADVTGGVASDLVGLAAGRGGAGGDNVSLVIATRQQRPARRGWWRRARST